MRKLFYRFIIIFTYQYVVIINTLFQIYIINFLNLSGIYWIAEKKELKILYIVIINYIFFINII